MEDPRLARRRPGAVRVLRVPRDRRGVQDRRPDGVEDPHALCRDLLASLHRLRRAQVR